MSDEQRPRWTWSGLYRGGISRILQGSLIGQAAVIGVSPLLTRIYTPADFASLMLFIALTAILGSVSTLNWDRAISIPRSNSQAQGLVILALISVLLTSLILTVIILLSAPRIDAYFSTKIFVDLWWLPGLTVFVIGVFSTVSAWLVRVQDYGRLAARNATTGLAQALSTVALGLAGIGVAGLLSGTAVGRFAGLLGTYRRGTGGIVNIQSTRRLTAVAKRFRKFPLVSTWSRLINVLGLQVLPLLVVIGFDSIEAGLFALTVRVLAGPIGIVTDAVSQVFEGKFAALMRMKTPLLTRSVLTFSFVLSACAFPPALLIVFLGPDIFAFVFGEQWRAAGSYAQIVAAAYGVQFAISPVSRALLLLERQYVQLWWDVFRTLSTLLAIGLSILCRASLGDALIIFATVQILCYLLFFFLTIRATRSTDRWLKRADP